MCFLMAAQLLLDKSNNLTKLSLLPNKKNIEWVSILANNAPKLRALTSLTIVTECVEKPVDPDDIPVRGQGTDYEPL